MHRLVLVPGTNMMPFSPWKRILVGTYESDLLVKFIFRINLA